MFEKIAYAAEAAAPAAEPSPLLSMAPIFFIFIIFYFVLIRPQQKRQKDTQAMIEQLKKGDKVVTAGGIIGTVSSIQQDYLVLKVGDSDSKIEILKSAITGKRS